MSQGEPLSEDIATESDVIQAYRLLLRRDHEDLVTWRSDPPQKVVDLVSNILRSHEFRTANIAPLKTGHVPLTSLESPPPEALEWAGRRLQLGVRARKKLNAAISYLQAYAVLLSEADFKRELEALDEAGARSSHDLLTAASRLQALSDVPTSHTLTGWARSTTTPNAPLDLEVWADGRFLGRTTTGLYRHDASARLNSRGYEGFQFELPRSLTGRTRIMVREAKSRLILTDVIADLTSPAPDVFGALRLEIDGLRKAVEHLAERLPNALQSASFAIERYNDYYDAWIRPASLAPQVRCDVPMLVLLNTVGSPQPALEDAVWSLVEQTHADFSVVIGVLQRDLAFLQDLLTRARWLRPIKIDYRVVDTEPSWRGAVAIPADVRVIQLMEASGTAHPDALRCMAARFEGETPPAAVYCDDDIFVQDDLRDWRNRGHDQPRLKPAFDYDLLLQTPYLGSFLAFSRAHWPAASVAETGGATSGLLAQSAVLDLACDGAAIDHAAEVLYTHALPAFDQEAEVWGRIVADRLGAAATVEPHSDVLGAVVDGACRIRWRMASDPSALIIVPTRDRIDLLRPCVDSLLSALPHNRTRGRIHIIDHESTEAGCRAYLEEIAKYEAVEVGGYSGPFNWALMNNLAAHGSHDDVLIFLNNDTLVISPEWLDELTSLAMRDDVGVVGCRLVYGDGAVQHAGFLGLDERHRFLAHDGLGDLGSDPGYLGRNALVHRTIAVTGACMAVRRDVFRQIGGFDAARFQVEANDVDLCFKASNLGLKVLYSPFATLHHLESRTRTLDKAEDVRIAGDAADRIWTRWRDKACPDPWYNPRFDRRARHFARLRPI